MKKGIRFIGAVLLIANTLILQQCIFIDRIMNHNNHEYISQMTRREIDKAYTNDESFFFRSTNLPLTYFVNLDSVQSLRKQTPSLCKLILSDMGSLQKFYTSEFDFNTFQPLKLKNNYCTFDSCKSPLDCYFTATYFSEFSLEKKALESKQLPQYLFISDRYFNYGEGTIYKLMLRVDISNVLKSYGNNVTSELDVATKFIWKQRSKNDWNGWEKINPSQINDTIYNRFISVYDNRLKNYLNSFLFSRGYILKNKP